MAAPTPISWRSSSPMSWHCSIKVGLLGVLWSSGPGSTGPSSADDSIWGSCPSFFRWGPRDRSPAVRSDCQWWAFLGHDQRRADSWSHIWRHNLPYWRSVLPHGCIFATPPTPSPCTLPRHDPTANGPSAVPLPFRKATVCVILPCRRTSCRRWAWSGISTQCGQALLVQVGHHARCNCLGP